MLMKKTIILVTSFFFVKILVTSLHVLYHSFRRL
ncbi:unnamed protein product [Arabidopsis halleri]